MHLLLHTFTFFLVTVLVSAAPFAKDEDEDCFLPTEPVDFIVVGGGSAGVVVASRLSENPMVRVLLLEAGTEPPSVADVPLRTREVLMNPEANWNYHTESQTNCCMAWQDQVMNLPSGRGLGGTSNINSMIYTRGNRYDYDRLENLGISDWSYTHDILPTFKKMEDYEVLHRREDHSYHGFGGKQTVSMPQYKSPMADAFLQAGEELKYFQVDCNAQYQLGFTPPPVNIKDGVRWGSYHAYLEVARNRLNLHVVTEALVTKIKVKVDSVKRVTGVIYKRRNSLCSVHAKREVILSAGALRSPQILMLSGIGPREELKKHKIPIVHHLPGVGQNLKDHVLLMGFSFYLDQQVSLNFTRLNTTHNLDLWDKTHTGPMTSSNGVEGIAFFKSKSTDATTTDAEHPSFEISFFSDLGFSPLMFSPEYQKSFIIEEGKDAVTFLPILLQPHSKGEVRLRSANISDYPKIDPKYLSNPKDEHLLLEVLRIALSLGRSKAFEKYGAKMVQLGAIPGCEEYEDDTDDFWLCYIRRFSTASYHFTGSCKMSAADDPMGVVDSTLKVFGLHGLRMADVSVMPEPPAGHTHAVALLIGERAAEFIKHEHNL